jgi:hypothetical protein
MSELGNALHKADKPDLSFLSGEGSEAIGFIRREFRDTDIYFVANTSNRLINTNITLATHYLDGEVWNADTGATSPITSACMSLHLAPYESQVFVFSGRSRDISTSGANYCGKPSPPPPSQTTQLADLSQNWQLHFAATNKTETQSIPSDWTSNPTTLHYSGEAIYSRDFTLQSPPCTPVYLQIEGGTATNPNPPITQQAEHNTPGIPNPLVTRTGPGMRAWYDPPIREAAIVFINGQRAGSLWHPPYRLGVSKLLKPGPNHIEIHVYNTALNAWSALPPHDYKPLIEKYGDRFQMQDFDKVQPVPSGILGQIHLVTQGSQ